MATRNLLFFILIYLPSCSSDKEVNYTDLSLDPSFDHHDIEINNGQLYLSRGNVWHFCEILVADDTESEWNSELKHIKSFLKLQNFNRDISAGVGVDGYMSIRKSNDWSVVKLSRWDILKDINITSDGYVAVGGHGFTGGVLMRIDPSYGVHNVMELDHEINAIKSLSSGIIIAAGYGVLLRSDDQGLTWTILDMNGDFYKEIIQADNGAVIVLGWSGKILRSADDGNTWNTVRTRGNLDGVEGWNDMETDGIRIVAAGDDGQILNSDDAGLTWTKYTLTNEVDLEGIAIVDYPEVVVCGEQGFLATVIVD